MIMAKYFSYSSFLCVLSCIILLQFGYLEMDNSIRFASVDVYRYTITIPVDDFSNK